MVAAKYALSGHSDRMCAPWRDESDHTGWLETICWCSMRLACIASNSAISMMNTPAISMSASLLPMELIRSVYHSGLMASLCSDHGFVEPLWPFQREAMIGLATRFDRCGQLPISTIVSPLHARMVCQGHRNKFAATSLSASTPSHFSDSIWSHTGWNELRLAAPCTARPTSPKPGLSP